MVYAIYRISNCIAVYGYFICDFDLNKMHATKQEKGNMNM